MEESVVIAEIGSFGFFDGRYHSDFMSHPIEMRVNYSDEILNLFYPEIRIEVSLSFSHMWGMKISTENLCCGF